jgi:hypothetical protein
MKSFFTTSDAAGRAYVERLQLRKVDRDAAVSKMTASALNWTQSKSGALCPQAIAMRCCARFVSPSSSYTENHDIVVIPINAFLLERHLPDGMYPDASHGRRRNMLTSFLIRRDYL